MDIARNRQLSSKKRTLRTAHCRPMFRGILNTAPTGVPITSHIASVKGLGELMSHSIHFRVTVHRLARLSRFSVETCNPDVTLQPAKIASSPARYGAVCCSSLQLLCDHLFVNTSAANLVQVPHDLELGFATHLEDRNGYQIFCDRGARFLVGLV